MVRQLLCALLGGETNVAWHDAGTDEYVDVHSFRRAERLKVHEARTQADLYSRVVRVTTYPSPRGREQQRQRRQVPYMNLQHTLGAERRRRIT